MLGFEIFHPRVKTVGRGYETPPWGDSPMPGEVLGPRGGYYEYDPEYGGSLEGEWVEVSTAWRISTWGGWEYFLAPVWSED